MTTATLLASQLATPPKPPFPRLERALTPDELEHALRGFQGSYYVEHPFHKLMYAGNLTQRQFQGWVANRLAYQRVVPRKDAAILSNCPDPDVRREWIQRIIDHDGTAPGTGGIELWIRLGIALGVPREEMEDERHLLPHEAVGSGLRVLADRAVRAQDPSAADRGVPEVLPLDSARGTRLLQEPAGAGAAGRDPRPGDREAPLHDRGHPARGLRGARVQA